MIFWMQEWQTQVKMLQHLMEILLESFKQIKQEKVMKTNWRLIL